MKGRKTIPEAVKNIVIVLLLISAVFLGWESRLFGNASVKLSLLTKFVDDQASSSDNGAAETVKSGVARPLGIAVTGQTGAHYGIKYNMDELSSVYDNTVLIFGDALGSAQGPDKVSEQDWRAALRAPGVYFEYLSPIPLTVLGGWFETETTGALNGISVRRMCVATVGGSNRLYFQDSDTGLYYAAGTAVTAERMKKLEAYAANNASYAFEVLSAQQQLGDPYTLLLTDEAAHPKIDAKNPLEDERTQAEALRNLGVSEHQKPIPGDDGSLTYIMGDFRIELSPDGSVSYKRTGGQETPVSPTDENGAVRLACQAVSASVGKYCGAARIYADAVRQDGGVYTVAFKYVIAGGQIYVGQDGYAASVTVSDGRISNMELRFRNYSESGANGGLMPEIQAAAAAAGPFVLCYSDGGADVLEPDWVVVSSDS